jgi:2-iminobutanoate/2-iminopropanoate deaminase
VLDRVGAILLEGGAGYSDVAKLTTYLVNADDYPAYNRVRSEYFADDPPASSTVVVKQLLSDGLLIEVEAVAVLSEIKVNPEG